MSLFFSMNLYFVYQSIAAEVMALYHVLKYEQCLTNYRVTQNLLNLASMPNADAGFNMLQRPGIFLVPRGEVVHVFQCVETQCQLRHDEDCYSDALPVSCQGVDQFLLAKSHILSPSANRIECSSIMPPMFYINDTWFTRVNSKLVSSIEPHKIETNPQTSFNFNVKTEFLSSGIYTSDEISKFKTRIINRTLAL
jgi:hypothetical protein